MRCGCSQRSHDTHHPYGEGVKVSLDKTSYGDRLRCSRDIHDTIKESTAFCSSGLMSVPQDRPLRKVREASSGRGPACIIVGIRQRDIVGVPVLTAHVTATYALRQLLQPQVDPQDHL